MNKQMRARDFGMIFGTMKTGTLNAITDVEGVSIGHSTVADGDAQTGVTAIMPHPDNPFREKLMAGVHVINGFGKSNGLIQIQELGTLETPILLTNTLSVGICTDALVDFMLERNEDIGLTTGSVNPVVFECNDGEFLNDIRGKHINAGHVREALSNCTMNFNEGAVGAGRGMSCYKLKGGIGSASRVFDLDDKSYVLGVLVLTNHGEKQDLQICGTPYGHQICEFCGTNGMEGDKGSIIIVIATDVPLSEKQLERVARRSVIGIARTGSYMGHGSGEIALAFSTANRIQHYPDRVVSERRVIASDYMDTVFRAAVESVEEAIVNSLITAETVIGRNGNTRVSFREYLERLQYAREV